MNRSPLWLLIPALLAACSLKLGAPTATLPGRSELLRNADWREDPIYLMGVVTEGSRAVLLSSHRFDLSENSPWPYEDSLPCPDLDPQAEAIPPGCYRLAPDAEKVGGAAHPQNRLQHQIACPLTLPLDSTMTFSTGQPFNIQAATSAMEARRASLARWVTLSAGASRECYLAAEVALDGSAQQGTFIVARPVLEGTEPKPLALFVRPESGGCGPGHPSVQWVMDTLGDLESFADYPNAKFRQMKNLECRQLRADLDADGTPDEAVAWVAEFVATADYQATVFDDQKAGVLRTVTSAPMNGTASRLLIRRGALWDDLLPDWSGIEAPCCWNQYRLIGLADLDGDGVPEALTDNLFYEGTNLGLWRIPTLGREAPLSSTPYIGF